MTGSSFPLTAIERQIRLWEVQDRLKKTGDAPRNWPIVTISRQYGAGGARLAARLAERLGFEVWDRELVKAISEQSGAHRAVVDTLDEHRRSAIQDVIEGVLLGSDSTNRAYLEALMQVVHTVSAHGRAIVIGRGARYMLDPEDSLRV